jgi:phage shock protein PspC (stress-responsive transcriptional regulator)
MLAVLHKSVGVQERRVLAGFAMGWREIPMMQSFCCRWLRQVSVSLGKSGLARGLQSMPHQAVLTANPDRSLSMTDQAKPLASPKDNLLGICNALGEDFGFDPLWLRLALGAAFVLQPVGVVIAYLALGLLVLASRLAFPTSRKPRSESVATAPTPITARAAEPAAEEIVYAQAA